MTVRLDDLLNGHPFERTLRASLLEHASGEWLRLIVGSMLGRTGRTLQVRTALPLLGPWASPRPVLDAANAMKVWWQLDRDGMRLTDGEWFLYAPAGAEETT